MQVTAATAALLGSGCSITNKANGQAITQDDLLQFDTKGQVTLLNFTDCHAQLVPLYFREPSMNLGVGAANGVPPHLTGETFLKHFGLRSGTRDAYAFTSVDFATLAKQYGRIGGFAHMATLIKAIRAERPNNTLLIDCGDTWQGSYTSLLERGADMVKVMNALGVEVMTSHWEFTYGQDRVKELVDTLNFPFLAGNIVDNEWQEKVFDSTAYFEKGGVKIAVIGQAFPYTPVANPRYMMPDWSFGIREGLMQKHVDAARAKGAQLVVLASHNGFDVDRKMASRIEGIDVILTGHTHDAIPGLIKVKDTLLVAAGSHGKFLGRLDLDVEGGKIKDYSYKLIPIFSDAIAADPEIQAVIDEVRKPHLATMSEVLGRSESLLYRRGNFNGSFDDMICDAIMEERDTQIALSPGFRWGASLLPGQDITQEDLYSQTSITYPNVYRIEMTGASLKATLEDVADNLFNVDPYYQQGGDMVRVGGMGYSIDINQSIGKRISDLTLLSTGEPIAASKSYTVGGWASVRQGTPGPPIYDLVADYIRKKKVIDIKPRNTIKVVS